MPKSNNICFMTFCQVEKNLTDTLSNNLDLYIL